MSEEWIQDNINRRWARDQNGELLLCAESVDLCTKIVTIVNAYPRLIDRANAAEILLSKYETTNAELVEVLKAFLVGIDDTNDKFIGHSKSYLDIVVVPRAKEALAKAGVK